MDTCPFCELIANSNVDRTMSRHVCSFPPLNPVVLGHRLFVPVVHTEVRHIGAASAVGRAVEQAVVFAAMKPVDYNIIVSFGHNATQTIKHLHVHYVPRTENDELHLPWTNQVVDPPVPDASYAQIEDVTDTPESHGWKFRWFCTHHGFTNYGSWCVSRAQAQERALAHDVGHHRVSMRPATTAERATRAARSGSPFAVQGFIDSLVRKEAEASVRLDGETHVVE